MAFKKNLVVLFCVLAVSLVNGCANDCGDVQPCAHNCGAICGQPCNQNCQNPCITKPKCPELTNCQTCKDCTDGKEQTPAPQPTETPKIDTTTTTKTLAPTKQTDKPTVAVTTNTTGQGCIEYEKKRCYVVVHLNLVYSYCGCTMPKGSNVNQMHTICGGSIMGTCNQPHTAVYSCEDFRKTGIVVNGRTPAASCAAAADITAAPSVESTTQSAGGLTLILSMATVIMAVFH